jgi:hypothetical protein
MASLEHQSLEQKIASACGLMHLDVPAATVIGGQMEDDAHPLYCLKCGRRLPQVGADEFDTPVRPTTSFGSRF